MPIAFHPKPGQVLICDFDGYKRPEMIKKRPVVVVSPAHLRRPKLVTVVPLSTTRPNPVEFYHYRMLRKPIPGGKNIDVWAKCDMLATVCLDRLDRVQIARGRYEVPHVSMEVVRDMRLAALLSLGLDLSDLRA